MSKETSVIDLDFPEVVSKVSDNVRKLCFEKLGIEELEKLGN